MNLIDLKNYLNLVNPSDDYKIFLSKELTKEWLGIKYSCTIIPRYLAISKNKSEELILEAHRDELNIYFPWLYKVLNIEYLSTRNSGTFGTFEVRVYKVTMKD